MNSSTTFLNYENETEKIEIRELALTNGINFPSDAELIMLILGSGTKDTPIKELARQVLYIIMSSNPENLMENLLKIKGIGKTKALMITAALELGRRINKNPQIAINSPAELIPYIQNYAMQRQEHFLCITLNGAKEVISIRIICIGASNMAIMRAADVFAEALKERASAIIISHNHPSGNPTPSRDDISTTYRLVEAADILGIAVLDHIIITKTSYFSFLEHGLMDDEKLFRLFTNYDESKELD